MSCNKWWIRKVVLNVLLNKVDISLRVSLWFSLIKFHQFGKLYFCPFPQGFRICKNIGHPTSGSGGKKTVKRNLKSEQTDRQTDRRTDVQTDGRTNRLIESIGPEGRCFENQCMSSI